MIKLVRAEIVKLRTTQVWFWLLLATIAISQLAVIGSLATADRVSDNDLADIFNASNNASIAVFVLGALGITTEFRYQTITPTVLITPSRWTLVTAKLLTYAIVGLAYAVVCVGLQVLVAAPWVSSIPGGASVTADHPLHTIVGLIIIVVLYAIIGIGVGALLRNQVVAVTVGVIFILVIVNVVLAIPKVKNVWPYAPSGASAAILHTHGSPYTNGVRELSFSGGVIVLLLWAFVPAIIGAAFSLNRDIT